MKKIVSVSALIVLFMVTPSFAWKLEGDANRDCAVNILDIGTLNKYWGADRGRDIGDVDHNGHTDVFDILLIKHYYGAQRGDKEYKGYLDLDKNGIINSGDVSVWVANHHVSFNEKYRGWLDLNKDGIIDIFDLGIVSSNWGNVC